MGFSFYPFPDTVGVCSRHKTGFCLLWRNIPKKEGFKTKNATILEISKSYVMKFYGGDLKAAIKAKDGIVFDNYTILSTFGSLKEFERYKKDNSIFCHYISL